MDPFELLQLVNEAIRRGDDPTEVEARLASLPGSPYTSIAELSQAAGQARQASQDNSPEAQALARTAERSSGSGVLGGLSDFARAGFQGATLEFGDEIIGGVQGLGAAAKASVTGGDVGQAFSDTRQEATEASRQRMEDMSLLNPGSTTLSKLAGGLLGGTAAAGGARVGAQAARGAAQGARSASGVLGTARGAVQGARGATSGARSTAAALRGPASRTLPMQFWRAAGIGGAAGAGAGATESIGREEGGLLDRTSLGTLGGAAFGAGAGILGGAAIPAAGIAREAMRRTTHAGTIVSDILGDMTQRIRGRPPASPAVIDDRIKDLHRAGSAMFSRLDDTVDEVPRTVHGVIQRNPTLRDTLEKMEGVPPDVAAGIRPPSFTEAQHILRQTRGQANVYRTGAAGTKVPNPNLQRQAEKAADTLEDAFRKDIAGYPDASRAWAMMRGEEAARDAGRGLRGVKSAEELGVAIRNLPDEVGIPSGLSRRDAANYAEYLRDIARDQVLHQNMTELAEQSGRWYNAPAAAKNFFNADRGMRDRFRVLLGDTDAADEFFQAVEREASGANLASKLYIALSAAAFLGGGSSLLGKFAG